MPFFSIIVPVYNVELYLASCMDSVLRQNFTDYECILIDDGSTDKSSAICNEFSAKDKRIKVIHQKNSGPSAARNTGILNSIGDYIVFLDADDFFTSADALFNLFDIAGKSNSSVIFNSNLTSFNREKSITGEYFRSDLDCCDPVNFYLVLMHSNKALFALWLFSAKRDFLLSKKLFFKNGILHEDELWITLVICSTETIAINHNPFYSYRRSRENSTMAELKPKRLFDQMEIIDILLANMPQAKTEFRFIFIERCISLWYNVFGAVFSLGNPYADEKAALLRKLKEQKYLLLRGRLFKHFAYFFFVFVLGLKNTYFLKMAAKKILKKGRTEF